MTKTQIIRNILISFILIYKKTQCQTQIKKYIKIR